jgi:hypothetical protein
MTEERKQDRRRGYSFRRHLGRLKSTGRLKNVGLAAAAVLTLSGITFARCRGSDITGPPSQATSGADATLGVPDLPSSNYLLKKAIKYFPDHLLPKFNACIPDLPYKSRKHWKEVHYKTEKELDADGKWTGRHKVWHEVHEYEENEDEDGNRYRGYRRSPTALVVFSRTDVSTQRITSVIAVRTEDFKGRCVTRFDPNTGETSTVGSACDFEIDPSTFDLVFMEDPITGEATVTINPLGVVQVCRR